MQEVENFFPSAKGGSGNITPPQAEISFFAKLKTKWPIVLGALGSIALFAAIIYAAYFYGRRGQEVQPTPTPTLAVTPIITPVSTPEVTTATPAISSEGKIAFVRDGNIWIANDDGTEQMDLKVQGGAPMFSPDKKWIVFIKEGDVFKVNIESKEQMKLTFHGVKETSFTYGVSVGGPKWSPNGSFISYTLGIQRCIGMCAEEKQEPKNIDEGIWVVDAKGKETKFLVPKTKIEADPSAHAAYTAWLPSGDKLIFRATGGEQRQFNIYPINIIDIKTGETEEFEMKYGGGFSWSRDGKRMTYYTLKPRKDNLTQNWSSPVLDKIYLVEDESSKIVFDNDGVQGIFYDDSTVNRPLISLDGGKLFFENGPNSLGSPYSFAVIELNNGVTKQLNLDSKERGLFLRGWSDDSMRLIFDVQERVESDNLFSIWSVNFDGTNLREIVKFY